MGKKVYFLDSVKKSDGSYDNTYGVDDVNAIVSNLVGAGVAPFTSGDTYDVSELNSLTSALVTEGMSLDGLKISFVDNKIHIAQGIGYFENGATIVVDSDGEELEYNIAETLYVYAEYNQALNTCGFRTSEKEPSKELGIYTLMLATIAADGTVTDKRVFAQSKVGTLGRNIMRQFNVVAEEDTENEVLGYFEYNENDVIFEVAMDLSKFNVMILDGCHTSYHLMKSTTTIDEILDASGEPVRVFYGSSPANNHKVCINCRYVDGKLQLYVPPCDPTIESARYYHACLVYLKIFFY